MGFQGFHSFYCQKKSEFQPFFSCPTQGAPSQLPQGSGRIWLGAGREIWRRFWQEFWKSGSSEGGRASLAHPWAPRAGNKLRQSLPVPGAERQEGPAPPTIFSCFFWDPFPFGLPAELRERLGRRGQDWGEVWGVPQEQIPSGNVQGCGAKAQPGTFPQWDWDVPEQGQGFTRNSGMPRGERAKPGMPRDLGMPRATGARPSLGCSRGGGLKPILGCSPAAEPERTQGRSCGAGGIPGRFLWGKTSRETRTRNPPGRATPARPGPAPGPAPSPWKALQGAQPRPGASRDSQGAQAGGGRPKSAPWRGKTLPEGANPAAPAPPSALPARRRSFSSGSANKK